MKRSEAARYARWSASAALLLAMVTAGVYVQRSVKARLEKRHAPPPAPVDVTKLTSGITFSKVEGNRKIFTLEASKSTDFKGAEASLIEDVRITIFGETGERHDTIHTSSCRYGKESQSIVCSGDVRIDLESAADFARTRENTGNGASDSVHVETKGVTFDRGSGTARTDEPVEFNFPNGNGDAIGVEYKSVEGSVRLLRDVNLKLKQPTGNSTQKNGRTSSDGEQLLITGTSLDFGRDTRSMHLVGPVQAQTRTARLDAGELTLTLDQTFRAQKLVATKGLTQERPEWKTLAGGAEMGLNAEKMTANFADPGWITRLKASGNVHGSRHSRTEEGEFVADDASMDMWPQISEPKELNLAGAVLLRTRTTNSGEERVLETSALRMDFSGGAEGQRSQPKTAETLAAGTFEWSEAAAQGAAGPIHTKLQADKLTLMFGPKGKPGQLLASGNVQTQRVAPGRPIQTATAKSGSAELPAHGGWSQINLQGDVSLKESDRTAHADNAMFSKEGQTVTLASHAVARDLATETQAGRIMFIGTTGDIHAEGGVRSTDLSSGGTTVHFAPTPANITSDMMQANARSGHARYTGHARLWQGDAVLEADSIELLREAHVVNATGNVRTVFPETTKRPRTSAVQVGAKKSNLWEVTAGALTYREAEGRAHFEKNVVVQSADLRTRAPALDVYFSRSGQRQGATDGPAGAGAVGATQQISRAVGTGGVIVEQGERRATAERGEYTAADGKFVMSGGNPTLYDASEGTTTGRQLTFFLADDTIIVDSDTGSRTLTKHRVEK